MMIEIIANSTKDSLVDTIQPDGREIILWTGNWDENINQIINEKRGNQYERELLKQIETENEIEHRNDKNHRIVREVSHVKRFTNPLMGQQVAEMKSRLRTEQPLFHRSENMIEIREETVELICIRIPVRE